MTFVLEKNMMLYIFRRAYSAFLALFFFTWEEFYANFEVLTEDFEGVPYIEFELK